MLEKIRSKITEKQYRYLRMFYCFLTATIFLFLCSKCSFLYPFNNWDDPNSFFTMGKGMANGLVLYKDLFEQKGPLLYLLHAIAYLLSNTTFLGVFFFEIISFTIFLYYIHKIISLYARKIHLLWTMPAISFLLLSSYVFIGGDSAEEFCFPLLAISLYHMLNYYKNCYPEAMPRKQVIFNGFLAGCVLCIKYNLLGFWFAFAAFLCIGLLFHKKIKEAFLTGFYFLLGMAISILPWIFYFAINGGLYDMLNIYLLVNISAYATQVSIMSRIITALSNAMFWAKSLFWASLITFIGYGYIVLTKKIIPNLYGKIALTGAILCSTIGIYYGANHVYYFLFLMPFVVLGLIAIAKFLDKYICPKWDHFVLYLTPVYLVLFAVLSAMISPNFNFHTVKQEELVQYQFAQIIQQVPEATLLNYGFLDAGFYTVTNITPNIKHFHKPNIAYEDYPEIMDEQNRYIREKLVDFVVIKVDEPEKSKDIPCLQENYDEVKTLQEQNQYYMLFQVKKEEV